MGTTGSRASACIPCEKACFTGGSAAQQKARPASLLGVCTESPQNNSTENNDTATRGRRKGGATKGISAAAGVAGCEEGGRVRNSRLFGHSNAPTKRHVGS